MSTLPTGTVSLLFSDVEGSTLLLQRLGPAYAQAVDGHRQVQRSAWTAHGGTEMGTEGDSFYVVFPTAEGAVKAAVQAQRELAAFEWPGGERVRVRMGIHTGAPTPHDGAYVGMDVHRAARIAGAAHGGQVLLSHSTAGLVSGCLPGGVALKDLGSHQLKDIPTPERVFQLVIEGLQADFPQVKTLGASSTLPRPATPLVGRSGELAELTALLSSPDVRLVTLTGPGGSGKTRLAIGVAERLVERFPDGVYFVALAAVTTADVMWTTIAETLDVHPQGRIPPGFFDHLAHRTALLVLDNLEQLVGADNVVAELLDAASQIQVIATSRRRVNVPGEHVHAVRPLEIPEDAAVGEAEKFGAVQLFVQHARMAKGSFTLTPANSTDVVAVCQRLDGLPLAIELAAARVRLLSPAALLARLDKALDLTAAGNRGPNRQKTLRDTIAWSYDLLSPIQQGFFRHLGVFAGGADLDAVSAVTATTEVLKDADPLDLVADLVDASLATITEDHHQGEPRVGMLETIRSYALDQLRAAGELGGVRRLHAGHFRSVAEYLRPQLGGGSTEQVVEARRRLELDHDNVREALTWALQPDGPGAPGPEQVALGLRLCAQLAAFWVDVGYYVEGTRWLERALSLAADEDNPDLARCLRGRGHLAGTEGDWGQSLDSARKSVAMWQRLGDTTELAEPLRTLAIAEIVGGDLQAARHTLQLSAAMAEEAHDRHWLADAHIGLANVEAYSDNFERAIEMYNTAQRLFMDMHDDSGVLLARQNRACTLRKMGRLPQAAREFNTLLPQALQLYGSPSLVSVAEDYAAVLAELGEHRQAVRLLGAADAMRARHAAPRPSPQEGEIAEPLAKARVALPRDIWDHEYQAGLNMTVEDAVTEARQATGEVSV